MKRYFYEPGGFACGNTEVTSSIEVVDDEGDIIRVDHDTYSVDLFAEGFLIFDRLRGHVDDKAIALCLDHDHAQKIVDALNAAEAPV